MGVTCGFSEEYKNLPSSIQNLLKFAVQMLQPKQVILFGSRARGDFRENSDYAIAFLGVTERDKWLRFKAESEENPLTLLSTDLVLFEEMNDDYKKNVRTDGKVLYE